MLLAWVWVLFGIGDGWPGVGCFGVAWGWGMADYVQRSSGLLAACGAIDLCRGSPHYEVSRRHSRQHVLPKSLGD